MPLDNEEKLTLTQAAKLAPGRPNPSSLWRHCRKGCKVRGGGRVYLEYIRFGNRIFTSREALDRFGHALAEADAEHFDAATARGHAKLDAELDQRLAMDDAREGTARTTTKPARRTAAQRERDIARANAELEAAGI